MKTATKTAAAEARKTYEAAKARYHVEAEKLDRPAADASDEAWDAYDDACEEIHAELQLDKLSNECFAAEDKLLDEHLAQLVAVSSPEQAAMLRETNTKGRRNLSTRAQLVDIALRS